MSFKEVFRFHRTGDVLTGMYSSGYCFYEALGQCGYLAEDDFSIHPKPDFTAERDMYFGFSTMEQLRKWVYDFKLIEKLYEFDYVLGVFLIPDSHKFNSDDCQCAFEMSQIVKTTCYRLNLDEVHEIYHNG